MALSEEDSKIVDFPGTPKKTTSGYTSGTGSINMRSDLVEEASKTIPEPPVLINLVSTRVKQLNLGRTPLVETDHRMGAADIALTEIIEGKISVDEAGEE